MGAWEEEEMGNEKSEDADEGRKGGEYVSSLNRGPQVTTRHSAGMPGSTWLILRLKRHG